MAEGYLRSAQAALSASATLPSAEERRAEAAMAESLAASGAGAVAKTAVGVAGRGSGGSVAALADRARRGVRVRCDPYGYYDTGVHHAHVAVRDRAASMITTPLLRGARLSLLLHALKACYSLNRKELRHSNARFFSV